MRLPFFEVIAISECTQQTFHARFLKKTEMAFRVRLFPGWDASISTKFDYFWTNTS
jgi:hypothetical protein